jgi:hypothetical protein
LYLKAVSGRQKVSAAFRNLQQDSFDVTVPRNVDVIDVALSHLGHGQGGGNVAPGKNQVNLPNFDSNS